MQHAAGGLRDSKSKANVSPYAIPISDSYVLTLYITDLLFFGFDMNHDTHGIQIGEGDT